MLEGKQQQTPSKSQGEMRMLPYLEQNHQQMTTQPTNLLVAHGREDLS